LKGDLRFNPDTGEYQHIDGKSQFGQSFDDFGRRFGVFNRVQVQHFVLPSHYIARNPRLSFGQVLQNCPELEPNPFLPGNNGAARLYPISANITTADSHAGTFTAACAIHIYRADGLPGEYYGHAFSCDPTGNLVHHDRLNPIGATFAAERVREKSEFLRSRDDWFRPVFLATGPDGALYVADIYRKVIEHPEYLPVEIRKRTNFEGGKGMGRICRVMSDTPARSIRTIQLAKASNAELVPELDSPNSWQRDTAFRLLSERRSEPVIPLLKKTVGRRLSPAGASATLHLLALLNALDGSTLSAALTSPYAGVRETALKLSESHFEKSPQLRALALKLADDADPRVRFQCALSIGPAASKPAVAALVKVATHGEPDRWTRAAILSSVPERDGQQMPLLRGLLETKPRESEGVSALLGDLSRMIAAGLSESELRTTLNLLLSQSAGAGFGAQSAIINGFAESARGMKLSGSGPVLLRLAPNETTQLFRTATNIALGADQPVSRRLSAVRVLANASYEIAAQPLRSLLGSAAPAELQIAAIRALTAIEEGGAAQALLEPALWKSYSPALREAVLSSLLSRPRHLPTVLTALESGAIPVNAIESGRREQLKKSKDDSIRTRAEKLFASMANGDRMKAYEEAKTALSLKPSGANGKEVFKRACANCHRLDGEGFAVGPDLFDIRNHSKESILLHIIIPEYEIAPNFANYICETKDGRTLSGILIGDVPAGITLRQALGVEERISRSDIASLNASPLSLMPQELEKGMTKREIADLLAYLRGEN
jgi:putative heme-binding domain-containing protein